MKFFPIIILLTSRKECKEYRYIRKSKELPFDEPFKVVETNADSESLWIWNNPPKE